MIPLLPALVKEYHASPIVGGALLSVPAVCSAIAAPIWGKFSDRLGRKPVIMTAQVLSLLGYLMLALSHSLWLVFISRVISGCGGGSLGAAESYIADVTKPEKREQAYALYGAVFGLAFVVGPVTAGALMQKGVAIPFFIAAALEALNLVFTGFFLPNKKASEKKTSILASIKATAAPGVRNVLVRQFLFIFGVVCYLSNFALYASRVLHMDPSKASYLLAVAAVVGGVTLVAGVTPLAKRFGQTPLLQVGLIVSVIAYAALALVSGEWGFLVAMIVWAVGAATCEPTMTALLSKRAAGEERGAVMGVSDSIRSIAMILGPTAGAALVGGNARLLCVLAAVASIAAFGLGFLPWAKKD